MQFHELKPETKGRRGQRIGRGGKRGTTAGRGTKGQKARAGHKIRPEIRDVIKRIPKLRGRGKHSFRSFQKEVVPVNLNLIEKKFSKGDVVSFKTLLEKGLIRRVQGSLPRVKILGGGGLTKSLSVMGIPVSKSARRAVEKVGGTVE